jgi:hypothetical protein
MAVVGVAAEVEFGGNAAGTGKDVFADDAAVPDDVVLVDVGGFALASDLDDAVAGVVVDIGVLVAVVVNFADAVVFVRACVVGASAPYNHGLPLAGADDDAAAFCRNRHQSGLLKSIHRCGEVLRKLISSLAC